MAETTTEQREEDSGVLNILWEQFGDVPLFLRKSLGRLSNSAKLVVDDFFWLGREPSPLHPFLSNAFLAIVNRRRKTAFHFASRPFWQQPIYLVLRRDGEYMATCCGDENGTLVVHPYGGDFYPPLAFRNHQDAEVVGQIVALARRLL